MKTWYNIIVGITLVDEAVVISNHKLGESDKIATLITRNYGKISTVVKGVRKTTSKFGASLSPFMRVSVKFSVGRNLDVINEAEIIEPFGGSICNDYNKYLAASSICDFCERLALEKHEPNEQLYLLLVRALRKMGELTTADHENGVNSNVVALSFLLRALAFSGWEIEPDNISSAGIDMPVGIAPEITEYYIDALMQGEWARFGDIQFQEMLRQHGLKGDEIEAVITKMVVQFATNSIESRLKYRTY
jgi:hypothetical protein